MNSLKNINPTKTKFWESLKKHYNEEGKYFNLKKLFKNDFNRGEIHKIHFSDYYLDFSKNRINQKTIDLLCGLASECELENAIDAYFGGFKINETEKRAVLHTALRSNEPISLDGKNLRKNITDVKEKIKSFTNAVVNKQYLGCTKKSFTDVVNIGIGGSDLGPAMVTKALVNYKNHLNMHFVSNIDGDHITRTLKSLNPETTLFIIVSKTFTTQETLANALTAKKWFLQNVSKNDIATHFVAISTNLEKIREFGINKNSIFPMWDWVGGRFSLWSAVGLSISLSIGYRNFEKLLEGAHEIDIHFKNTPFSENIPVILALLGVWYTNFFNVETEAVIPYNQNLIDFVSYLQQNVMESNGKFTDRGGNPINYQSSGIIWGEPGTNSQHAFFQLLHQGTKLIPTDFIGFKHSFYDNTEHHNKLMSNFFAQTQALMNGKEQDEVYAELKQNNLSENDIQKLLPFKIFEGNKPTNTLLIDSLTPKTLGGLISIYEHKIFVQGIIWNIYSYDQWGVELGKQLANKLLDDINRKDSSKNDSSTNNLLKYFLK